MEYSIETLVKQRLYSLTQGYEDLNDHEQLRHDPLLLLVVGKVEAHHGRCAPLAGKSTLNRLEKSYRRDESDAVDERYVKIEVDLRTLETVFVDLFIAKTPTPPPLLILDLDVTDDTTYSRQEQSAYNGHYKSTCYTPLYLFCGKDMLVARLSPANVAPADGALEESQRVVLDCTSSGLMWPSWYAGIVPMLAMTSCGGVRPTHRWSMSSPWGIMPV